MSVNRAVPEERETKSSWPETTPLLGATPTLPDDEVSVLVQAVKSALEAAAPESAA